MLRKITRIFFRTTGIIFLALLLISVFLFFAFQTYGFQTWLGRKASAYLSDELETKVYVHKVELELFTKANLQGLFILDKHKDTILHGDLLVNISNFNYRAQTIRLEEIILRNATSKLIKYKADSTFNYQFIIDYFDPGKADTTSKQEWEVSFGEVRLQNVAFMYRREKFAGPVTKNINFDNIWLQHTFGTISGFKMEKDTVVATVKGLMTIEQSGFKLSELSTNARISSKRLLCDQLTLKTPATFLRGKIQFHSSEWDDYNEFINKVRIDSYLRDSSYVSFPDIAAFAKELNGLNETVKLAGAVKGTVNDLRLKDFKFGFGNFSKFHGNIHMTGLPDIQTTFLHFDAKGLTTNYHDIERIPDYPFTEGRTATMPEEVRRLGTISYKGKFDGFISDFTMYGTFNSALGRVKTDLSVKVAEKAEDISYHGKISTDHFNLGTMLGLSDFNGLSMQAEVKGKGSSVKSLRAGFNGQISTLTYNGYNYSNITLKGDIAEKLFNGVLTIKDPNADFDFNGTVNFKEDVPQMDFISTINKLNLKQLHFTNKQDSGVLSSQILINVRGSNIDNLTGNINFDNTIYKTKTRTFKLSTFDIQMEQNTADKKIRMTSEYLNATAFGQFRAENLKPAFQVFLYHYYPTFFKKPVYSKKLQDEVAFYIRIKKFKTINELFLPDLMVSPNTVMEGNFSAAENKLNMQLNSDEIKYKKTVVKELVFILNENRNTVIAEASGRALHFSDSMALEHFNIAVNSVDKVSSYSADWDNLKTPVNKGEIKGQVTFENSGFNIHNEKLSLTLRDSTWAMTAPNYLRISKDGQLMVDAMTIANKLQSLNIEGSLSSRKEDSLLINMHGIVLQQFNPLLDLLKLKLEGVMNGRVTLSNADKVFAYNGFLTMEQLKINDNTIGELVVHTNYHTNEKFISLDGFTSLGIKDETGEAAKNIAFNGTYDLEKKEDAINIDFSAKPANLSLLNPFVKGILDIKSAFVNGSGKIHGSPDNIKIDGKFRLFNSEIKVDYTNVTYNITGDIEIMPDQIRFSDLLMREKGSRSAPQGTINGNIFHTNFNRMQIDYDISYKNMLVLNTSEKENNAFYGRIYGTGNVGIYGSVNNLNMQIYTTTNKYSKFFLPLDGPAEIGENDFIHFVKKDTLRKVEDKALTGFNLTMTVQATPDAQTQIIFDKKTGDVLNVQGQGELRLNVNTLGKFEMYGDYIITDGDYLFTLENVINKKFDIEAGSSISWSGNPMTAEIDVTASYRQRASVAPLLNDTTGRWKGRVPVDCKLVITEKLFSPKINFAIDFPSVDATSSALITSVLSDEAEMNRQVFSFLLFRTFVTPLIYSSNAGGVTPAGLAASTGSELLSNRVSEFLNTYFGTISGIHDLQLGLNYRPGNSTNNEAVDLALSKQFLDNKVTVDGNFGVNNNARNSNSLIGDVNVDYKLTNDGRFRLKGFNRSNDNTQIATAGGAYTQGVGFFYRIEFETFRELWKRFQVRVKKEKAAITE